MSVQKNYATIESYANQNLKDDLEKPLPVPSGPSGSSGPSGPSGSPGPSMNYEPIPIQNLQHKKKILADNGLVIVLVHAKWCGPCKSFKPLFYSYSKERRTRCYFAQEDVDLGLTEGVNAVPSILVYNRGKLVHIIKGGNLQELDRFIPPM